MQPTFMAHTMLELPDIVRLAVALGIDRIKGHHLWAHFDEIKPYAIPPNPEHCKRWINYVAECYQIVQQSIKPDGTLLILENIHPLPEKEGKTQTNEKS